MSMYILYNCSTMRSLYGHIMQILCNLVSIIPTKMSHNNESSKILTKTDSEFCYQS